MRPLCSLDNPSVPIVLDTSVWINVNATGCAADILHSLPHKVFMVDVVSEELGNGRSKGRTDADQTLDLVKAGLIRVVRLGEVGLHHFQLLVSGSAEQTIDDGEAATIAFAVEAGAIALIDERKATKICDERFENLALASSVDVFTHPSVQTYLGPEALAEAVFNALQKARMSVQDHHLDWVVELIGAEKAVRCRSLPKPVRASFAAGSRIQELGNREGGFRPG